MALQTTQATSPDSFSTPGRHGSPPPQPNLHSDKGKKPMYQNRSWVRGRDPAPVDGSPTGSDSGRPSLLSRLESPSLLKRLSMSEEEESAVPTLADRLAEPTAQDAPDEGEIPHSEDVNMPEEGESYSNQVRVKTEEAIAVMPPSPTTRRAVRKARGSRSTINVFGEPTVPVPVNEEADRQCKEETNSPPPEVHPVSAPVVESFLASIVPSPRPDAGSSSPSTRLTTPRPKSPISKPPDGDVAAMGRDPMPVDSSPQPSSSSSLQLPVSVLAQTRDLLIPTLVGYAMRRNPGLDEQTAKRRIIEQLSVDKFAHFVKLATQMRSELAAQKKRESGHVAGQDETATGKRRRDGPDDADPPVQKMPRIKSPENTPDGDRAMDVEATESAMSGVTEDAAMHVQEEAAELQTFVSETTGLASRGRSGTPASYMDLSSLSLSAQPPRRSRQLSIDAPSRQEHVAASAAEGLLPDRNPLPPERARNTEISLPSSATIVSHSLPQGPHCSPSPAPVPQAATPTAEAGNNMFTSQLPSTSHHATVTSIPAPIPEDHESPPELTVAQDEHRNNMQDQQSTQEQTGHSATLVPALWAAVVGRPSSDIQEVQFFVDDGIADATQRWACRREEFSFEHNHVKVHLLCLPTATVAEFYQNLAPTATREEIVAAIWDLKTEWPTRGTLVVKSGTDAQGDSWFPDPDSGPLDITSAIVPGTNSFRLIQLKDMSDRLFVFHATEPTDEERRAVGAQTIAWMRTLAKLAPQSSGPRSGQQPLAIRASVAA
ncbi:hypothetical protein BD413DRAFT_294200 [Trametes elegans]|nr:hypothetical protein BD413DRAFT_294200 [Trametes elegans]